MKPTPIYIDDEWSLIEKISNEYDAQTDSFIDFYIIRHADGTQSKLSSKEIKEAAAKALGN